jgi:hypothetical protein
VAGITLAAFGIPEVMGYTKIIGTPVITELYTLLPGSTLESKIRSLKINKNQFKAADPVQNRPSLGRADVLARNEAASIEGQL